MVNKIKICCALFQLPGPFNSWDSISNARKVYLLRGVIDSIDTDTKILLLPAGFFNNKGKSADRIFNKISDTVAGLIMSLRPQLRVCLGIDGKHKKQQFGVTISKKGIVALAKKFLHKDESVELAPTPFHIENGLGRIFRVGKKKAYLAVCYDIFGISRQKLSNPGVHFILNVVHGFGHSGGDSDFARKGLAGAAKQWASKVFASAVFADNRKAANWPSGVKWKHGNASVKDYKYDDIRISHKEILSQSNSILIILRYCQC